MRVKRHLRNMCLALYIRKQSLSQEKKHALILIPRANDMVNCLQPWYERHYRTWNVKFQRCLCCTCSIGHITREQRS